MTSIADLILTAPDKTHGHVVQFPSPTGEWRHSVEIADPLAGEEIEWHDLTDYYVGDHTERGGDEPFGRFRGAESTVTFEVSGVSADNRLSPTREDNSDLFGVHVPVGAGLLIRSGLVEVVADAVVTWYPLFTNIVFHWGNQERARGRLWTHQVQSIDTRRALVRVPVAATTEEGWDERIETLLTNASWLFGADIYGAKSFDGGMGPASVLEMPARDAQSDAQAELDATCDPAGIVWRSRRNGRLVFHPAPGDEFHSLYLDASGFEGDEWDNPLLDELPDGIVFSVNPEDETETEFIRDDVTPFEIADDDMAVINSIAATFPFDTYNVDDPTSVQKFFSRRHIDIDWIVANSPAVDRILATRKFATKQATPIRTDWSKAGFFPAMALIDHLDPTAVIYQPNDTSPVTTGVGRVRRVVEDRQQNKTGGSLLWWTSVEVDLDTTVEADPLLPVENLQIVETGESHFEATWTNPTQPSITPTHVQFRVPEISTIWLETPYPATSLEWSNLDPSTFYRLEVRLIRVENGVVTNVSPTRRTSTVTLTPVSPHDPGPDPDGTDPGDTEVTVPDIADEGCDLEWELQRSDDGTTWTTILSGDQTDMTPNGDGSYSLTFDESEFDDGFWYRVRSRENCGGVTGDWFNGTEWQPPADWEDPCVVPSALSTAPYDSEDLVAFVPKVCSPDHITEAVSGIEGAKGPAFAGFAINALDSDEVALRSGATGGVVAYGQCNDLAPDSPLSTGWVGRLGAVPANGAPVSLWALHGAHIEAWYEDATHWVARAKVFLANGSELVLSESDPLDLATVYDLKILHDTVTGAITMLVDDEVSATYAGVFERRNTLPIWQMQLPSNSWATNCAAWDAVAFTPIDVEAVAGFRRRFTPTDDRWDVFSDEIIFWRPSDDDEDYEYDDIDTGPERVADGDGGWLADFAPGTALFTTEAGSFEYNFLHQDQGFLAAVVRLDHTYSSTIFTTQLASTSGNIGIRLRHAGSGTIQYRVRNGSGLVTDQQENGLVPDDTLGVLSVAWDMTNGTPSLRSSVRWNLGTRFATNSQTGTQSGSNSTAGRLDVNRFPAGGDDRDGLQLGEHVFYDQAVDHATQDDIVRTLLGRVGIIV